MNHVIKCLLFMVSLSLMVNVIGVADPMFSSDAQLGISNPVQTTSIGDGFFEFRSNVEGAGVFLDDQRVGTINDGILKVPVQVYNKTIQHQLRIEAPGYSPYHETIVQNPKAGETKVVRGTLQVLPLNLTGTLSLAVSPPGSTVSVDNMSVGVVGQSGILTLRTVKSGSRLVRVTMPGYQDSIRQVFIDPNLETKVRISLIPVTTGILDISSNPSGAEVLINGAIYGITPLTTADLENGIYVLEFNLPGYQKVQSQITLGSGQRMPVSISLQPEPPETFTPVPTTPVPTSTQAGLSPIMVIAGLLGACYLITKME